MSFKCHQAGSPASVTKLENRRPLWGWLPTIKEPLDLMQEGKKSRIAGVFGGPASSYHGSMPFIRSTRQASS